MMSYRFAICHLLRILALPLVLSLPADSNAYRVLFFDWTEDGSQVFGSSLANVGDVDGNGVTDFVVGDMYFDDYVDPGFHDGRAYLYLPTVLGEIPSPHVLLSDDSSLFGKELGAVGDMNGDGFADFAITSENIRAVYLFLGAADPATIERIVIPSPADERSTAAMGVGDVNGDGYDDLLVGALWDNVAWLYYGSDQIDLSPDLILSGEGGSFGLTLTPLGDFDGDGYADFAVGAPSHQVEGMSLGAVHIYRGGVAPDISPDMVLIGRQEFEGFGRPIRLGGDLDGDGTRELLVSAPFYDGAVESSGRIDIYSLDPIDGPVLRTSIYGEVEREIWSVDGETDIDTDGTPDIVLTTGESNRMSMFSGAALMEQEAVSTNIADWSYEIGRAALVSIGDLDGDGFSDLALGGRPTTHGPSGDIMVLAGGHRVISHFRPASIRAPLTPEIEIPILGVLKTTDTNAQTPLAALEMTITFDPSIGNFLGAEPAESDIPWLFGIDESYGMIHIAMATTQPELLTVEEQPLVTLHFETMYQIGTWHFEIVEIEAYGASDMPLWTSTEPGQLIAMQTVDTPPATSVAMVQAQPNPCNPRTTLTWQGLNGGATVLEIFDARGRLVWKQQMPPTESRDGSIVWQAVDSGGRAVASAAYLLVARGVGWRAHSHLTVAR